MLSAEDLKKHEPDGDMEVVVATMSKGRLRWFVSYIGDWHLADFDAPADHEFRRVDEHNFEQFLAFMAEGETTSAALHQYFTGFAELFEIFPRDARRIVEEIIPVLYVDADRRFLCVLAYLGGYTEEYLTDAAPEGWRSDICPRLDLIPEDERYWIVNGQDMIKAHVFDWEQRAREAEDRMRRPPASQYVDPGVRDVAARYRKRLRPWWRLW